MPGRSADIDERQLVLMLLAELVRPGPLDSITREGFFMMSHDFDNLPDLLSDLVALFEFHGDLAVHVD